MTKHNQFECFHQVVIIHTVSGKQHRTAEFGLPAKQVRKDAHCIFIPLLWILQIKSDFKKIADFGPPDVDLTCL